MAELKTKKTAESVAAFIKKVPEKQKREDSTRLVKIFQEVTGKKPVMWGSSIIGFDQYHYKSERSSQEGDWPMAGFSPRKQNMTIYIMPGFKNYKPLLKKLGTHTISGGSCIYFNRLDALHLPTLKTLIKRSVTDMRKKYRV